jgi:creatinine amidohydrolase
MEKIVRLEMLTRGEIGSLAPGALAVIPVGAVEQHGFHLPISTDAVIIEQIAVRACQSVQEECRVFMTPVQVYGNSHHHFPFPALSFRSETLIAVLKDLAASLVACGFKHIMLLNSHGGNDEAIRIVARDISREYQVSVAAASYWSIAWNALVEECGALKFGRVPGHAGGFESSLMLAICPEQVRMDCFPPLREDVIPKEENARRIYVSHPNNSVGVGGYSDDARHASKEAGEKFLSVIVREVAKAFCDFLSAK